MYSTHDVKVKTLPSGITLISERDDSSALFSITVSFRTGSKHDPDTKQGTAHFVEHMLFQGTTARTSSEIKKALASVGANYNAGTGNSETSYTATCLAAKKEVVLQVFSDMFTNSIFEESYVEREREVILQERSRYASDAWWRMVEDMYFASIGETNWRYPIIGTEESIRRITREDLVEFYQTYYKANNCVITVVGNLGPDPIDVTIEDLFSGLGQGPIPDVPNMHIMPSFTNIKAEEQEEVSVALMWDVGDYTVDRRLITAVTRILGQNSNSYLNQVLREERALSYAAWAILGELSDRFLFTVTTSVVPEKINDVIPAMYHAFERMIEEISEEDLEVARVEMATAVETAMEATDERCSKWNRRYLSEGRVTSNQEIAQEYAQLTPDMVRSKAIQILTKPLTLGFIGKTDELKLKCFTAARDQFLKKYRQS